MYIADGDYIKDIEVNDLRNRYTLTKGSTQKMVNTLVNPLILLGICFETYQTLAFHFLMFCLWRVPEAYTSGYSIYQNHCGIC